MDNKHNKLAKKRRAMARILCTISAREREVLRLSFVCCYNIKRIAQILETSKERVRQIRKKGLERLRSSPRSDEIEETCGPIPESYSEFGDKLSEWMPKTPIGKTEWELFYNDLPVRAKKVMFRLRLRVHSFEELLSHTVQDLLECRNCSCVTVAAIVRALEERGMFLEQGATCYESRKVEKLCKTAK